jgi:peptidoglycan/LPS O-acetylase OafA/YrhL
MYPQKMPRLVFQRHGVLGEDNWHSVLISILRGLAALIVAAAHLRAAMYPGLHAVVDPPLWFKGFAFFTGFAHQAVIVFFVISGWLVGGSLLNRLGQPQALSSYAVDRLTRLWTVLIPTFLLTLLFAASTGAIGQSDIDYSPDNKFSAVTFAGNLVGLQHVLLPDFGGNFALWSLANETWYYLAFPLLVLVWTTHSGVARFAYLAALLLLSTFLPSAIVGYFLIWLLGVAFSRVRIECGSGMRWAWAVLLAGGACYYRLRGELDAYDLTTLKQDVVCALLYLVLLASLQFKASPASKLLRPLSKVGHFFAEFSFSLYVLHVPLIGVMHHWITAQFGLRQLSPAVPLHTAIYGAMLAILVISAYVSYRLFESRTPLVRRAVKDLLLRYAPPPAITRPSER